MPIAKEVMVENVKTFHPQDKVSKVAETFAEYGISGAPVVDDENRVVGVVTEHDLIRLGEEHPKLLTPIESHLPLSLGLSIKDHDPEKMAEALSDIKEKKVEEAMTENVRTLPPDAGLGKMARVMKKHEINRVPIVDEDNKLLGLVARADVVKGFWEKEEE
ncbi:hypothetical protein AKJ61_04315 [candidate division MSBL1 archaeon SCGC-AAA259B11]|uniref:CBS domain-containing protein n=1 Tax=candidate division MSBL1 archaeon SCGC-AAA259B11 TaxID=1698260 RepID=A0A133U3H8_9EURY|nr:hypothetical protein AKJ61_04315 [candidate division MSBL1 archaeon SCGC-AAA259B11]